MSNHPNTDKFRDEFKRSYEYVKNTIWNDPEKGTQILMRGIAGIIWAADLVLKCIDGHDDDDLCSNVLMVDLSAQCTAPPTPPAHEILHCLFNVGCPQFYETPNHETARFMQSVVSCAIVAIERAGVPAHSLVVGHWASIGRILRKHQENEENEKRMSPHAN